MRRHPQRARRAPAPNRSALRRGLLSFGRLVPARLEPELLTAASANADDDAGVRENDARPLPPSKVQRENARLFRCATRTSSHDSGGGTDVRVRRAAVEWASAGGSDVPVRSLAPRFASRHSSRSSCSPMTIKSVRRSVRLLIPLAIDPCAGSASEVDDRDVSGFVDLEDCVDARHPWAIES